VSVIRQSFYVHHDPDEYKPWEVDKVTRKPKWSQETHEAIHYAAYESKWVIDIDTDAGTVDVVEIWNGDQRYIKG